MPCAHLPHTHTHTHTHTHALSLIAHPRARLTLHRPHCHTHHDLPPRPYTPPLPTPQHQFIPAYYRTSTASPPPSATAPCTNYYLITIIPVVVQAYTTTDDPDPAPPPLPTPQHPFVPAYRRTSTASPPPSVTAPCTNDHLIPIILVRCVGKHHQRPRPRYPFVSQDHPCNICRRR